MPAARTRVTTTRIAHRANPDRPSQDRIFTTPNAVIVLDGASEPTATHHDGGWYAETLGRQLRDQLHADPAQDLRDLVAEAIRQLVERYRLVPGGPSSTVSIVRWDANRVHALALGDSPIVVATTDGQLFRLVDHRLDGIALEERLRLRDVDQDREQTAWQELVVAERAARNTPGGYWIAEASPEAAEHALCASWKVDEVRSVLVMTDGVAVGVDQYHVPERLSDAITLAQNDPGDLVDLVHDTEAHDPDRTRWPRAKRHDDKAAALVEFRKH